MKKIFSTIVILLISGVILSQLRIYTPELVAPADNAVNRTPNVVLDWNAVTGSTLDIVYEMRLDTDPSFSNPLEIQTIYSAYKCSELYFGTRYYWQVRATDGIDTSYWSEKRSFTTIDRVELKGPNNNIADQSPDATIKWDSISGVTHYDIQVDTIFYFNQIVSPTSSNLYDVYTLDQTHAWAVGQSGKVIHYDGTSWSLIDAGAQEDLNGLFFVDENNGWIVGALGTIVMYDGTSWTDQSGVTGDDLNTVFMTSSSSGWAAGEDGTLLYWDGASWTESTPLDKDINDLFFLDENNGWAVGKSGSIYKYSDGTWSDESFGSKDYYSVFFLAGNDGWACGKSGQFSHYDGTSWSDAVTDNSKDLFALSFAFSGDGYALGKAGFMVKYENGTWDVNTSGVDADIRGLSLDGNGAGWAVGANGIILDFNSTAFNSPYTRLFHATAPSIDTKLNNLPFGVDIFWRVRARHSKDTTQWSKVRNFYTIKYVVLQTPATGATKISLIPKLKWKVITGVTNYKVQVADNNQFNEPKVFFSDSNAVFLQNINFGKEYFWRVKAYHPVDSSFWQTSFTFNTVSKVTLTEPANNAVNVKRLPLLKWEKIDGVNKYQLHVSKNPDMSEPFVQEIILHPTNTFQIIYMLDQGADYYWRARAIKAATTDTSNWSDTWKFTIEEQIGINDNPFARTVKVFPNPSSGILFLELNTGETARIRVVVMDLVGQTFVNKEVIFDKGMIRNSIDLKNMPNGVYVLKLESGSDVFSEKLILNK